MHFCDAPNMDKYAFYWRGGHKYLGISWMWWLHLHAVGFMGGSFNVGQGTASHSLGPVYVYLVWTVEAIPNQNNNSINNQPKGSEAVQTLGKQEASS